MNKIIFRRLPLLLLIGFTGWLGFSCLNYSAYTRALNQTSVPTVLSKYNLLVNSNDLASLEMQSQAQELDKVLEFMVWPTERKKLLLQSIHLTQQQINQQPTQFKYWQRLLNVQYELNSGSEQVSWILEKVYKLGGWNHNWVINLSRYCVPFAFKKEELAPEICNQIISHLPELDTKISLARRIGVSDEDLDVVLSRYQN